jgi:hypothetical protein
MGYRSNVRFVVALPSEAERNSIMALYSMHPLVQEHDIATEWTPYEVMVCDYGRYVDVPKGKPSDVYTREYPVYLLSFYNDCVKWYDNYEDVQAVMHMEELLDSLEGRCYAYRFIRVGEDHSDIECKTHCSEDKTGEQMYEYLSEVMYTEINLVFDIKQIEA